jgi:hypothetical protein
VTTLLNKPEIAIVESLTERCDSCSAAAKLEVHLSTGGGLAFCGHHANKHGAELFRLADKITVEDGFEWAGKQAS